MIDVFIKRNSGYINYVNQGSALRPMRLPQPCKAESCEKSSIFVTIFVELRKLLISYRAEIVILYKAKIVKKSPYKA